MRRWCYLTIYILFGHCLNTIATIQHAGDSSNLRLLNYSPDKPAVQNTNRQNKKQQAIWQHRGWEHCLRDELDFQRHVDYIHYNPVKHGYVKRAADWQHSSIHRYIKLGMLNEQWGGAELDFVEMIGDE